MVKFTETESRIVLPAGKGGMGLIGTEFQFGVMKKFWRWIMVMTAQQCKCM